jgi:hypothetical protein
MQATADAFLVEVHLITNFADKSVVVVSPHQAAPVGTILLGFYAGCSLSTSTFPLPTASPHTSKPPCLSIDVHELRMPRLERMSPLCKAKPAHTPVYSLLLSSFTHRTCRIPLCQR